MMCTNIVEQAPALSRANKQALAKAEKCGCYFCLRIYAPETIDEWVQDKAGETALCPNCSIDSVIPDSPEVPVDLELLKAAHRRWFCRPARDALPEQE
jgi:hypothetical protein